MSEQHPRFLVFRGGAIGDFILTLPALQALRSRWPEADIELMGYPHIAELAVAGGLVDRVSSINRASMAQLFTPKGELEPDLVEKFKSSDVVISYLHDPDEMVRSNMERVGAKQVIGGTPIPETGHAADHFMLPMGALALFDSNPVPRLSLDHKIQAAGQKWLEDAGVKDFFAIHPGSGSPSKNWPWPGFKEVVQQLEQAGRYPLFVMGEADGELRDEVLQVAKGRPLLENLSLVELAGVLSHATGYLGNDSGISHLAAALGLKCSILFGPSDPQVWGPRGDHVTCLRARDHELTTLAPGKVFSSLEG